MLTHPGCDARPERTAAKCFRPFPSSTHGCFLLQITLHWPNSRLCILAVFWPMITPTVCSSNAEPYSCHTNAYPNLLPLFDLIYSITAANNSNKRPDKHGSLHSHQHPESAHLLNFQQSPSLRLYQLFRVLVWRKAYALSLLAVLSPSWFPWF